METKINKVAVVTGAANGIGWATAQRWAQEGYRVALLDLGLDAVQARASELGQPHMGLACDVTCEASVSAAIAT